MHHREYLEANLNSAHPIFLTRLWTSNILNQLAGKVYVGTGKHPITRMTATGIPPHILLANEIVSLRSEVAGMKEALIQKLNNLPDQVKATMLENFCIDGTLPITLAQVEDMMQNMQTSLLAAIAEQGLRLQTAIASVTTTDLELDMGWSYSSRSIRF